MGRQLIRRWIVLALLWSVVACASAQTPVMPAASGEVDAQTRGITVAQTVVGIIRYVRWPQDVPVIQLCIVGPTEYADELSRAQPFALAGGRRLAVRREAASGVPSDCAALYIGLLDDEAWRKLLQRLPRRDVLTIGERKEQCQAGGMFCLDVREKELTFEVNLDSLDRSTVRVHPNVLLLARRKGRTP